MERVGRRGRRLVGGLAVAAAWMATAWWLRRTDVPAVPLDLEGARAAFDQAVVARAERYERGRVALWAAVQVAVLATLGLYALRGTRLVRRPAGRPVRTGALLALLGLLLAWLVQLPLALAATWWSRRNGVSRAGALDVIGDRALALVVSGVVLSVAVVTVMALARRLGERWWAPGGILLAALALLAVWATPLVPPVPARAEDEALLDRYERLAAAQGVEGVPLRIARVGDVTGRANAYARGIAGSREVVLWDTLLDGRFSDREVDVVLAHELAHHARAHPARAAGWLVLLALPAAWLVMRVTRGRGGMAQPAAIPLALLVVWALQLVLTPAVGWVSRGYERAADWDALTSTHDPAAARTAFVGLAETGLRDPDPPRWRRWLLATHPTPLERVALADAWERALTGAATQRKVPG